MADTPGSLYTRNPRALASALEVGAQGHHRDERIYKDMFVSECMMMYEKDSKERSDELDS